MKKKVVETNGGNHITNYMVPTDVLNKKEKQKSNIKTKKQILPDIHESSMEVEANLSSKTEVIHSDVQNQMIEQKRVEQMCLQLIMIAPFDTTYFRSAKRKIQGIRKKYNKSQLIKFILQNAKFSGGATNLTILEKIDDDQFWNVTVPQILADSTDQKKQKSIASKIQMLIPKTSQSCQLSKAQIYMILINMFLCIFPKQSVRTHNKYFYLNFSQLMSFNAKDAQSAGSVKLQKLKCIINYLKMITKRKYKDLQKIKINVQRVSNNISSHQLRDIEYRMKDVYFQVGLMEQRYKYDMIIDFANKNIGGGILTKGAVQEQILFCIFPELIATLSITYELGQNQALIIYNTERFSVYEGYSDKFKYVGPFEQQDSQVGPFESVVIAVDAIDFKNQLKQSLQYSSYYIERELKKFLNGIQGADYQADEQMHVCTGKWGCGAFGGNLYCKFLIQWIGCSIANKQMRFMCQTEQQVKQLTILVKFMKKFDTLQILEMMEQYTSYFGTDSIVQISFIQFLKKYCC